MPPKVSIIVPVYNASNYIRKCVDSILSQTLEDIEIILINDGSVDDSKVILEEYKAKDSRVKVIHQENSGPSVARNNGIKIARGSYIGFVDSDDYIEPTMYEKLFSIADSASVQMAMCNYREVHLYDNTEQISNHNLKSNYIYKKCEIEKDIISTFSKNKNYGFYSLVNKVYNREWLLSTGIFLDVGREHGEDWWFNIQIFMKVDLFICVEEALYNYIHVNRNSLMGKYRENQFELCLDGRLKLIGTVPKEFIDYEQLNERFFYEFNSYIIRTFKEVNDKSEKRKLVFNVLNNEEVNTCCKSNISIPFYLNIIKILIRSNFNNLAFQLYWVRSIVK